MEWWKRGSSLGVMAWYVPATYAHGRAHHTDTWVGQGACSDCLEPLTPQAWGVGVLARFPGHSESSGLDPVFLSCGLTAPVWAGHVSSVDLGQGNQGNYRDTWWSETDADIVFHLWSRHLVSVKCLSLKVRWNLRPSSGLDLKKLCHIQL